MAAFRRTVGAPGQRSTSKRGFSKACQQAIPTGAKGGLGRRNLHTRPIGLFSDPGKCLLQGFGGLRATDTCSVLVTGLCLGPQRSTHWPDGPTGTLGFSDRAEHAKSGLRGLWAVAGSSLQGEGQALSFSQRSLLKLTVTRGRLSRSQCLGTLCLKGEGGKRAKRKEIGLFQFSYLYFRLI